MILHTQHLTIRPLSKGDLNDMYEYRSRPEVAQFQGFYPMSITEVEQFIKQQLDKSFGTPGEWIQLGIVKNNTGKLIGDLAVKLQATDPRIAEVGITITSEEQNKGYGKQVMLKILQLLFDDHNVHRVVETTDADNIASIKLLESIGFRKEGHFIENIYFKGKWGSECQYAMLKREWDEKRSPLHNSKGEH